MECNGHTGNIAAIMVPVPFKVIVAGGRDFNNYGRLRSVIDFMLSGIKTQKHIEIVSGGAKGADVLGERYAKEMGYALKIFPADWDKYGKKAGPVRNQQMADYGDALVAFWDGKSKGTANMIANARMKNLLVRIIKY